MRKLFFFILSFYNINGYCQQAYTCDNAGNIYKIDIISGCITTRVYQCPGSNFTDIAVDSSGLLYLCTQASLYSVDLNNTSTGCVYLGDFPSLVSGLVVWKDGSVYASGSSLFSYNPATKIFLTIGNFPSGVYSAGDLVEYNNNMFMSCADGSIYQVNMDNPSLSKLYYSLGVSNVFGMMVVSVKCFDNTTVAHRVIAFGQSGNTSNAYLIDMEKKIAFPDYCLPDIAVTGCASRNTSLISGDEILIKQVTVDNPSCDQVHDGSVTVTMNHNLNIYSFSIDNQPDVGNGTLDMLAPGKHTIRIKNQFGCYKDTSVNLLPVNAACIDTLYVPSAFTPNEDGVNDVFRAKSILPVRNFNLQIFSRYGQRVYASSLIDNGWDGNFKSIAQSSGIYLWMARYTNFLGKNIFRKGILTLIR